MILTKKNVLGGRPVKGFPLREEQGMMGFFLGYDSNNQAVLMSIHDRDALIAAFHCEDKTLKKVRKLLKPKISLYESLLKWLKVWITRQTENRNLVDNI